MNSLSVRRGFCAVICIFGLCVTKPVYAGINQWTSNGPEGGTVQAFAIDPVNPATLYAGTTGGIFKSTDGGANWTAINNGLAAVPVTALVVDPSTPTILYAGTNGSGIFKSLDGGANWVPMNNGLTSVTIAALVIDPLAPTTLYAGTRFFLTGVAGVFKTVDGGASWAPASTGLPETEVLALAIDPITLTVLYAGTAGEGIFKSIDGGAHWTVINTGLSPDRLSVAALTVDPQTPTILYAGVFGGGVFEVVKTVDGGMSWVAANGGLPSESAGTALAIDPVTPTTVYAGTLDEGVFKSLDGGMNWAAMNTGLPPAARVETLAIDPLASAVVYAGTAGGGVFKSVDSGIGWTASNRGLANTSIADLVIDPFVPTTVYASVSGGGVLKSTDGGANWTPINDGLTSNDVRALAIDPVMPTTLYAGTADKGIFKTTNGGNTWIAINTGLPPDPIVNAVAIDPVTPTTLYIGTTSRIFSTDTGQDVVGGGVFKSTDGGASWNAVNTGLPTTTGTGVGTIAIDPVTPATLYASVFDTALGRGFGNVFKSTDGGATWTASGQYPFGPAAGISSLAIDPVTPTTIYAAALLSVGPAVVLKSVDGGESWTTSLQRNFSNTIEALGIDPVAPTTLYAGIRGEGVLRSTDGGMTWASMNRGLTNTQVTALAIDPTAATFYAGTGGGGVFSFQFTDTAPLGIMAQFESPGEGPVSGVTLIRGWAFSTQPGVEIASVELLVDAGGSSRIATPCCSQRADVQATFPQFPTENTLNSGWGAILNWALLSPGTHVIQMQITDTSGETFFSEMRPITVIRPGDFEFLDQFSLATATARVDEDELVVEGIVVRDKATQQQKQIAARFRWFEDSQSFGMVEAMTTAELSSWRSSLSSLLASLSTGLGKVADMGSAQASPGMTAFFESPENDQLVSGIALIRGWAFADEDEATMTAVRLLVDGQPLITAPCCSERANVAAEFPDTPNALNSGWGLTFNYGLLSTGDHTLEIQIDDSTGATAHLAHAVTVVKPGGFEFLDLFDLSEAAAQIEGEEIVLTDVVVRDKTTQQTKVIDIGLRWFEHAQALGIVAASE